MARPASPRSFWKMAAGLTADFFIDASGFRSQLLAKTLEEPFLSFSSSLFNDRAMVGSWAAWRG